MSSKSASRTTQLVRWAGLGLAAIAVVLGWWFNSDSNDEAKPADSDRSSLGAPNDVSTAPQGADEADQRPGADATDPVSGLAWVSENELPAQARTVLRQIDAGGPFTYDRDGIVFGNYERILPKRERGYYREYTVPTPGLDHRGARRIVTGGDDAFYYTADHYASFVAIAR